MTSEYKGPTQGWGLSSYLNAHSVYTIPDGATINVTNLSTSEETSFTTSGGLFRKDEKSEPTEPRDILIGDEYQWDLCV